MLYNINVQSNDVNHKSRASFSPTQLYQCSQTLHSYHANPYTALLGSDPKSITVNVSESLLHPGMISNIPSYCSPGLPVELMLNCLTGFVMCSNEN